MWDVGELRAVSIGGLEVRVWGLLGFRARGV